MEIQITSINQFKEINGAFDEAVWKYISKCVVKLAEHSPFNMYTPINPVYIYDPYFAQKNINYPYCAIQSSMLASKVAAVLEMDHYLEKMKTLW